jgi:cytidyltransferase-like protein
MTIGVTSGCFDILHPTHILYLEKCSRECDILYVLIDSDERVYLTKGNYPVFNEHDRLLLLEALEVVDRAAVFNDMQDYELSIRAIMSEQDEVVVFKNRENFPTSEVHFLLKIPGTTTKIIRDIERLSSSTQIKQQILKNAKDSLTRHRRPERLP